MDLGRGKNAIETLFIGILFLFFFQLLSDFIESIYASCLLTTGLNETIAAVLLLLSPVLLSLFKHRLPPLWVFILCEFTFLFRILETLSGPQAKMLLSGCGVASFLIFFPSYLKAGQKDSAAHKTIITGQGLILSVMALVMLKSVNSSIDITNEEGWLWIGWVLAAVGTVIGPIILLTEPRSTISKKRIFGRELSESIPVILPSIGLISVFAVVYFIFASPAVISRWSESDYLTVITVQLAVELLFVFFFLAKTEALMRISKSILVIWNLLFFAVLVFFIKQLQVDFPVDASSYPVFQSFFSENPEILTYLILVLHPVLFVDMSVFTSNIIRNVSSIRRVGFGFTLGGLFLLVLVFFHIFTTVYDYIPVIGPFFRDKFWFVHALLALGVFLPVLSSKTVSTKENISRYTHRQKLLLGIITIAFLAVSVSGMHIRIADPQRVTAGETLKVVTFNIQQGYDVHGKKNYDGQLRLLRELDPDIIGLQETDSLRIAGGNSDIVRYYADALNMYSNFGPSPVTGTFGIALLSKYPILKPTTFFMYSIGEQTATIEAAVKAGEQLLGVFVTHLGNDGDMVQQKAILERVRNKRNIILMGDFNFRPDTPQYKATTELLTDAWAARWPEGIEEDGFNPQDENYGRIDHIFLSEELSAQDCHFISGPESDHPALMCEIKMP